MNRKSEKQHFEGVFIMCDLCDTEINLSKENNFSHHGVLGPGKLVVNCPHCNGQFLTRFSFIYKISENKMKQVKVSEIEFLKYIITIFEKMHQEAVAAYHDFGTPIREVEERIKELEKNK